MNKSELADAIADEVGGRAAAQRVVDAVFTTIMEAVARGERVGLTGFGTFEKRERGARTARNIRTGATIKVKATSVPAFRAGSGFKEVVASGGKKRKAAAKPAAKPAAKAAKPAAKAAVKPAKAAAKPAAKAPAKKAPAKKGR